MEPFRRPVRRVGLGLKLEKIGTEPYFKVAKVTSGGPCDKRILEGDQITHINEVEVGPMKLQDIVKYTTGDEGSNVSLKFMRAPTRDMIKQQMDLGFKKRDLQYVKKVFEEFSIDPKDSQGEKNIPKENLLAALKVFDVATDITENDVEKTDFLYESLDRNGDKILDEGEFIKAVQAPTMLELLTRELPLHSLLADTIPRYAGDEPLHTVSELSPEDIDIILDEFKGALKKILTDYVAEIKRKYHSVGKYKWNPAASKFEMDLPRMKCGTIDEFHKGVVGRVGISSLDFQKEMELEHCTKGGHEYEFTTSNYQITTCAKKEWGYVVQPPVGEGQKREDLQREGKKREVPPEAQMQNDREIPDIDTLMELDLTKKAKLIQPEIISLVLYSGPMFHVYNAILRHWPEAVYNVFKEKDNLFPCTIFVLTSALQKLSRVTRMETGMTLYRGLKPDVSLPELFFKCNDYGCTGFTEWGFMSATAKLEVALQYTGVMTENCKDSKDVDKLKTVKGTPRVLQIQTMMRTIREARVQVGSVDRGADIHLYSQYPDEEEFMFVPCSFVEKCGEISAKFHDKGVVELVPVKVNPNLKAKTVEELLQQKKDMHIAAFNFQIAQVQSELEKMAESNGMARLKKDKSADENLTVEGFVKRIVDQCKDVLSRHQAVSINDYVNDRIFRTLVLEMVDTTANARIKLVEWLENPASFIRFRWNLALISVQRRWHSYLEEKRVLSRNQERDLAEAPKNENDLAEAPKEGDLAEAPKNENDLAEASKKENDLAEASKEGDLAEASKNEGDVAEAPKKEDDFVVASRELCQAMGLIIQNVNETNELGETKLMFAAAEGRSSEILRLLIDAKAQVDQQRPTDGVTALWLAAENGHEDCVETLLELNALVDEAAHDGTTPLCIAARNGKRVCVELLIKSNANVKKVGDGGRQPVHEAAMYGYQRTLQRLVENNADINAQTWNYMTPYNMAKAAGREDMAQFIVEKLHGRATDAPQHANLFAGKSKRLIVSTGDISDIDGFLALAEYAKLHADVIFVMNYPAYIRVSDDDTDPEFAEKNPGLGYKYSAKSVLKRISPGTSLQYDELMKRYADAENDNERMKCAMTDMAFAIAHEVWKDAGGHGTLFFYIGGVNAINPFSSAIIKNEVFAYADHVQLKNTKLDPKQGVIYNPTGTPTKVHWEQYTDIFMDFNGSLAFWSGYLSSKLSEEGLVEKIKGVFVMGGVLADEKPSTTPSTPNVLNRFSSATMNQLYHPQNAANFFAFLAQFNIPTFTVTNNVVADLSTYEEGDAEKKKKTWAGVQKFLESNKLNQDFLRKLAKVHYELSHNPPRKPFDFYTARALQTLLPKLEGNQTAPVAPTDRDTVSNKKYLFISNVYGITFVSPYKTWEETRACYATAVDVKINDDDSESIKTKKEYFKREIESMESIQHLASMPVTDLKFHMDDSNRLELDYPQVMQTC